MKKMNKMYIFALVAIFVLLTSFIVALSIQLLSSDRSEIMAPAKEYHTATVAV